MDNTCGIHHRTLDRGMTLYVGQNRKEFKKLKTFKTSNAMIEINAGGKLVKIKQERGLLERLLVISRNRRQLDLKECIATYEFGEIPRSLFASDVTALLAYDKSKILPHLEFLVSNEQLVMHCAHSSHGNIHLT